MDIKQLKSLSNDEINDIISLIKTYIKDDINKDMLYNIIKEVTSQLKQPNMKLNFNDLKKLIIFYYNQPKPLSNDDINDIISVITTDMIDAIDYDSKEAMLYNIRRDLTLQLKHPNIKLTKLGFDDLKKSILFYYNQSKMSPGKMVGIIASQSLGQPIMQIVLNAFHSAGAIVKGVSAGYAPIIDILSARKNLKTKYIQMVFNKRYGIIDTINMREKYVNVSLKKIIRLTKQVDSYIMDYILDKPSEIYDSFPYWYHNFNQLYNNINIDIIKNGTNDNYPMLRIVLDVLKIFEYKVNITDIYNKICEHKININIFNVDQKPSYDELIKYINIFISPILKNEHNEPIIYLDIFPKYESILNIHNDIYKDKISKQVNFKVVNNFLFMNIVQEFNNFNIQGLSNIKDIYPGTQSKWAAIKYVVPYINSQWQIWLDKSVMTLWYITINDIIEILNYIKVKVIESNIDYIIVESIISPIELYNSIDNDNKKSKSLYEKEQQKLRIAGLSRGDDVSKILTVRPESDFEKLININYLEVNGYNLESLYIYDDIDHYHTASNDVNEIYELYGIESARNFIIYKLYQSINANGEYIDSSAIILIADQMTHLGILTPFNYEGMSGLSEKLGPLGRSMYQRILEVMTQASSTGTKEKMTLSTASLLSSTSMPYGSLYNPKLISDADRKYIQDRYGTPFEVNYITSNLISQVVTNNNDTKDIVDDSNIVHTGNQLYNNDGDDVINREIDFTGILSTLGDASEVVEGISTNASTISNIILHKAEKIPDNLWRNNTLYKNYKLLVI